MLTANRPTPASDPAGTAPLVRKVITRCARVHRRAIGDVLDPEREPREVLDRLNAEMVTADFSAQYQQAPVRAGGYIIKWEWFSFYKIRSASARMFIELGI
jgi:hypothetical protein